MSFDYDVFISYRWVEPDQTWVRDELVQALGLAGLRVCLDVNDFIPGRDLILEMSRAGKQSRRAICVLSPEYFEGNRMVSFEGLMTRRMDPSGTESRLIPLVLRKFVIPDWLNGLIPVDWTNQRNLDREWKKLLKVLGAPKLRAKRPAPVVDANQLREPALNLVSSSEAFAKRKEDRKYAEIILWLADEGIDSKAKRHLLINKEHYTSVKSLLDDIYMSYLHQHVPPYTYGSRWLLHGSYILVPFGWVASPKAPIQDVDLEWIDSPLDDVWALNYDLGLVTDSRVDEMAKGAYGVLTNDKRLAMMVNSHPKSARYVLEHPDLFFRTSANTSAFKKYRFQFVYSIPAYRDLGGVVFVETTKVAENPKFLESVWKTAGRLA